MFFTPNYEPTIWMSQQKWRLIKPGNVFPIFSGPILVSLFELLPPFPVLSWQERHPVWSSAAVAHLLQGSTCSCVEGGHESLQSPLVPSWDLSIVLAGLQRGPFESLDSVELKFLSLKTTLLTALTSIKRVGDLQVFSVSEECLVFGPVYSHVVLRPRPGYVPKVPTTPFRDQVVNLQALPSEEADPALALLCPVRALRIYVDRTRSFRSSEQLFVCHGGQQKWKAVSKQRWAHWRVEAVALAYQSQGEPCPLGVRAHSTRSVASSYALAHGASFADICRAAGWATQTPSQDSTVSALSQFLPVCWVTGNGWEELAFMLAAPFPLTRGYERPFSPPNQFPGWWTLVESSKHPLQSDWAEQSEMPGPVILQQRLSAMRSLVNICMPQGCDGVQLVALSIGALCRHDITRSDRQIRNARQIGYARNPIRERRRYVPMPQFWTIAGCQGLVLGSSA